MIRKISLALLLCLLLAVMAGCASPQLFPTQAPPGFNVPTPTIMPSPNPQADAEYEGDPMGEEDTGESTLDDSLELTSAFAGSTPLPLDPIDMPTPTPRQALTFTYTVYEAVKLGLKFEGPASWDIDDTANDTYTITEPEKRDNYRAFMTLYKTGVSKDYNANDLAQYAGDMLDTIKSTNYTDFRPSYTAARTLMEHDGVYANYEGTLVDGTRVRGRVHVTCIDKVLYSLHMSHAAGYNSDYLQNHAKLRDTLELTK